MTLDEWCNENECDTCRLKKLCFELEEYPEVQAIDILEEAIDQILEKEEK